MKREIKLNMQHLSETVSSIQEYGDKLENLKSASTTFLNVLKNQDKMIRRICIGIVFLGCAVYLGVECWKIISCFVAISE